MSNKNNLDKNRVTFYLSDENLIKLNELKGYWRHELPVDKKYTNKLYNDIIEKYHKMYNPTEMFTKKFKSQK